MKHQIASLIKSNCPQSLASTFKFNFKFLRFERFIRFRENTIKHQTNAGGQGQEIDSKFVCCFAFLIAQIKSCDVWLKKSVAFEVILYTFFFLTRNSYLEFWWLLVYSKLSSISLIHWSIELNFSIDDTSKNDEKNKKNTFINTAQL